MPAMGTVFDSAAERTPGSVRTRSSSDAQNVSA
jgi:hypothetical protein